MAGRQMSTMDQFSVQALESTIGQQLLDLRYKSEIHSQGGSTVWMTGRQKWLYAVLIIGGPWLEERRDYLASITREYKYGDKLWKIIDVVVGGWKVAALINFLVFLSRGHYQYLVERILGVRAVFPRPQGIRQIGFEYMDRELLWHGFAEFLFFILPLINFNKVKNFLKRQFIPVSNIKKPVVRSIEDYHECAVCGQWPYNPREIGCPHVFCYYCIQSNYQADSSYACPVCGLKIESCDQIQILTQTLQKES